MKENVLLGIFNGQIVGVQFPASIPELESARLQLFFLIFPLKNEIVNKLDECLYPFLQLPLI